MVISGDSDAGEYARSEDRSVEAGRPSVDRRGGDHHPSRQAGRAAAPNPRGTGTGPGPREGADLSRLRPTFARRHSPLFRARVVRYLLDTHTFLWWITDDSRLSSNARAVVKDPDNEI